MEQQYVIKEFIPKEASESQWLSFYEIYKKDITETLPFEQLIELSALKVRMLESTVKFKQYHYFLEENNLIISYLQIAIALEGSPSYEENKNGVKIQIFVDKTYRRKGFGRYLFNFGKKTAESLIDLKFIHAYVTTTTGACFVEQLGAKQISTDSVSILSLNSLDWNLIDRWIKDGKKKNPKVQIEFWQEIPETEWEQFLDFYNTGLDAMPRAENQIRPQESRITFKRKLERIHKYFFVIAKEEGHYLSLTEIVYPFEKSKTIDQNLTMTHQTARGRGLAKWVKALALIYIKENYPDAVRVLTGNANANDAMLAINNKLGFKKEIEVKFYAKII